MSLDVRFRSKLADVLLPPLDRHCTQLLLQQVDDRGFEIGAGWRLADAEGAFIAEPGADGWVLVAVGGSMFFKRRMFGSTASD